MKKKVIAILLVGAGLIGTSSVAYAGENTNEVNGSNVKVEDSMEKAEDGTSEDNMGVVSEVALEQLDYAIEDMREAIMALEKDGVTPDSIDYILNHGTYSIDRVRPFFDELSGDKTTQEHVKWISSSWARINETVDKYYTAGDGTAEDNMGVASDVAVGQLKYAIEDMREAIMALDKDGITADSIDYILNHGTYAIERVRPFFDELSGDKNTQEHLQWISDSWVEINEAVDKYYTAGDGTAEDNMQVETPVADGSEEDNMQVEPPVADGSEEDNMQVEPPVVDGSEEDNMQVEPPVVDGSEEDNMQVEPPVADGSEEDNMQVNPPVVDESEEDNMQVNPPVVDGSEEDNMQVNPPVGDGTAEDNMQVEPPVGDGTAEDNMQVEPPVGDGTAEDNMQVEPPVGDGTAEDNMQVNPPVATEVVNKNAETQLPNTGGAESVGIIAGILGVLGIAKFSMRKK